MSTTLIEIATIACPEKESSLLRCTLNANSYRDALRQPKLWGVPNSIAVTSGRTRPTALRITKVFVWHCSEETLWSVHEAISRPLFHLL